jgi:hypothetical protein
MLFRSAVVMESWGVETEKSKDVVGPPGVRAPPVGAVSGGVAVLAGPGVRGCALGGPSPNVHLGSGLALAKDR